MLFLLCSYTMEFDCSLLLGRKFVFHKHHSTIWMKRKENNGKEKWKKHMINIMTFRTKKIYKEQKKNIIHAFCPTSSLVIPRASKNMEKRTCWYQINVRMEKEIEKTTQRNWKERFILRMNHNHTYDDSH